MTSILVVREFDDFSRILSENGFEIVNLPMIETKPLENLNDFQAKLKNLEIYDGIFLTSARATLIFREGLRKLNLKYAGKIYVLGKKSFEILKQEKLDVFYAESANTANDLLQQISTEDLENKRFLFVRGEKSLRIIPEFLSEFASVDETIVYRTEKIAVEIDKINAIREKIYSGKVDAACFFSPSAAQSFLEQFDAEILHQTLIAAIGTTTADFLEKEDLQIGFVASKATAEDFAFELAEFLKKEQPAKYAK